MDAMRSEHLRKMFTGACLMAAPLVILVGEAIHPDDRSEAADELATIAGGLDRWYAAHLVLLAGFLLLIPAVLGLAHMLHERRPMLAFVGGGLSLCGIVGVAALIGADGLGGYFLAKEVGATPDGVAAMDGLMESGLMMPIYLATLLVGIGLVVMGVGLWRTNVVAPWEAWFVIAGAALIDIGFPADARPVVLAGMVALVAGMAPIGYTVLTESDEEWAHTPEFRGFGRAVVSTA